MKRHSDGFSLIEVIIAISVLAVVAMSLLAYFSSANRYANWGKTTQKADMAAQSVVEELASCTTFEQIQNGLVASGSAWQVIPSVDPGDSSYRLDRDVSVDGTDYKARVKVDFDSYKSVPGGVPTSTPLSKFNEYEVPQLEKIYSEKNVVFEETDQTETALGDLFYQAYKSDKSITKETIRAALIRTMYIHIEPYETAVSSPLPGGAGENNLYLVKAYYKYTYKKNATTKYQCELPVKEVKIEKDALENVYLFYRPVNDAITEEKLDITADNLPIGCQVEDFSFYAILQKDDDITPPVTYKLEIESGGGAPSVDLSNKVYSNARKFVSGLDGLIVHKPKDRIAMITVEIYYADETDFKEENRIVMVQTSKGA